jgi:hypothetical protein
VRRGEERKGKERRGEERRGNKRVRRRIRGRLGEWRCFESAPAREGGAGGHGEVPREKQREQGGVEQPGADGVRPPQRSGAI